MCSLRRYTNELMPVQQLVLNDIIYACNHSEFLAVQLCNSNIVDYVLEHQPFSIDHLSALTAMAANSHTCAVQIGTHDGLVPVLQLTVSQAADPNVQLASCVLLYELCGGKGNDTAQTERKAALPENAVQRMVDSGVVKNLSDLLVHNVPSSELAHAAADALDALSQYRSALDAIAASGVSKKIASILRPSLKKKPGMLQSNFLLLMRG